MRLDKKLKKKLLLNAPYVLFIYLFDKVAQGIRLTPGADASQKLLHLADGFGSAFASPLPSFHPIDLLIGIAGAVIMWVVVYVRGKNAKKFRKNTEYGSARWGTPEDIEPYMDPDFRNNIILTQTERLTMNSRPKDPKTARNKNVLVIGGSGSGKTRFFVKPQLMQLHSSYVVTDPKGSLLVECGRLMERAGYKIKVFNTINFKKSMHYNPFAYIHSEKDILKLVNTLITNTKGEGKGGDDFWLKAETLLYTALIGYIYYEAPKEEQNFATLVEFINAMEVREDDETFENNVDIAFRELGERDPNHFAVRQWRKYKLAAGKTAKSINISAGARLAPFDIQELREITMYDELELDTLGGTKKGDTQKTVLFLIMSDTDSTFNFLISMIYSQLFNLLCEKADDEFGGRLPIHVRCLIDECANIGQIPNLEKLMATIRSREISACLVLQAQSQLKALYTVTVIGEENGWYKVIVPEKEGYVYGGYLKVSEGTVIAGDNVDTSSTGTGSTGDTDSGTPLTPDGNLELVDDVYQTSDGKQFITVQSKNDNTFYVVIDRNKNGENVYFLNLVDEADLMALMQDGEVTVKCTCTDRCEAGDVDLNCPVCKANLTECTGTVKEEPEPTVAPEEPEEPESEKSSSAPLLLLLLIAGLGAGGAVYWFKFRKQKPDTKGPDDLDDYDFGDDDEDDEEEYVIEDDQPEETDEV